MNKTTIYTLLCTTIMLPTISCASQHAEFTTPSKGPLSQLRQEQSQPGTPISNEETSQLKHLRAQGPDTPTIVQQEKVKLDQTPLDDGSKQIFLQAAVEIRKAQREKDLEAALKSIKETASKKRVERANEANDRTYELEHQKHQQELAALEAKVKMEISNYEAIIFDNGKKIEELSQQLAAASKSKETILAERVALEQQVAQAQQVNTMSKDAMQSLLNALADKKQQLIIVEQKERAAREALEVAQHERDQERKAKEALAEGIRKLNEAKTDVPTSTVSVEPAAPASVETKPVASVVATATVSAPIASASSTESKPADAVAPKKQLPKANFASGGDKK
ncbi:MAG: hypothetical protein FJX03_06335 [Alphaproteobacteria bacterium]|nr:hypothetical protein [Alphaproteobacteria bacterium]